MYKTKVYAALTLGSGVILVVAEYLGLTVAPQVAKAGCIIFAVCTVVSGIFEG